ncbi:MAG TPA: beta-glycosidase, partial [Acidimicrobiia bacterium]|nr:beta-glycosidase [Acidimicrobiia bacterium]
PKPDPKCVTRVNPKGFNDGLLYYDAKGPVGGVTQIFTTKRFYTLGQFSRYVRPGAVRHDVRGTPAGVRAMAFEAGARWTVVAWNEGKSDRTFAVELPNSAVAARSAVGTSASAALSPVALPGRTATGRWLVHLPARSIATFQFR